MDDFTLASVVVGGTLMVVATGIFFQRWAAGSGSVGTSRVSGSGASRWSIGQSRTDTDAGGIEIQSRGGSTDRPQAGVDWRDSDLDLLLPLGLVASGHSSALVGAHTTQHMNTIGQIGSSPALPSSLSVWPGLVLVRFPDRLKGTAIDAALVALAVASLLGVSVFVSDRIADEWWPWLIAAVVIAVPWLYFAGLESAPTQGTVGMLFSDARVSTLHGERIGFVRASVRFAVMSLTVLVPPAGIVSALIAYRFERAQAIHDMVARTLVVRRVVISASP